MILLIFYIFFKKHCGRSEQLPPLLPDDRR